jgi:2-oxopent-4-enoate/cis-2-oxohex-4-enoate hydratase
MTGTVHSGATAVTDRWSEVLYRAYADCTAIAPITASAPELTIEDAYAIQMALIARRIEAEGARVIGRKIGATSKAVQDMLNVHQPDFGHLLSTMLCDDGGAVDAGKLIAPRIEGELAFLLKQDLCGPGISPADVLRATEYVMPCLEIVDSRIADWRIAIQDTVADNASSGLFVLGGAIADPRKLDLALVGMTLEKNGQIVGTGAGAAALGHPLNSVAWLANTLGRLGISLKAGDVILSGAMSALVPVSAGDSLRVSIGQVGSASVHFTSGGANGA